MTITKMKLSVAVHLSAEAPPIGFKFVDAPNHLRVNISILKRKVYWNTLFDENGAVNWIVLDVHCGHLNGYKVSPILKCSQKFDPNLLSPTDSKESFNLIYASPENYKKRWILI